MKKRLRPEVGIIYELLPENLPLLNYIEDRKRLPGHDGSNEGLRGCTVERNSEISKAAIDYCTAGLSPIPCKKMEKHPTIPWKEFQDSPPSLNQVNTLFKNPTCDAIGILMGNGKETIDFDAGGKEYETFKTLVMAEKPGLWEKLVIEKTQNQGFHVVYKCKETQIPGSMKLAIEPHLVDTAGTYKFYGKQIASREYGGKHYCLVTTVETRGQGGLIICTPTPGYEIIQGCFTKISTITREDRDFLIEAARSFNRWVEPVKVFNPHQVMSTGGNGLSPAEQFNDRGDIKSILVKHGAVELSNGHWRRPGKVSGSSASLLDDKIFYVFSSNWPPFNPDTGYSKFAVYAYLEHNGDFSQAAQDLIKKGYGGKSKKEKSTTDASLWDNASERFPRYRFPWEVFPLSIAESLRQVANSCATSDVAMPGAAMAIMASCLGRTVSISPKRRWQEPQIIWSADIRESGEGKTPPVRMLLQPIYEAQRHVDDIYKSNMDNWKAQPKNKRGPEPIKLGARYTTNLTLEGLRNDLTEGHGGLVCVLDELSSMISSQNQYKAKGNDREAWISLWDGHDARISRVEMPLTIRGSRMSIFGGIQPDIFRSTFGSEKGLYITDGTIFRFLFVYETNPFVPITDQSWSEENCLLWESTIKRAMAWADGISSMEESRTHVLKLTDDAREHLWSYRNNLFQEKKLLPPVMRGFIPKSINYILRIAGILKCFSCFAAIDTPLPPILTQKDIEQAITVVEFYLAHTVSAMRLLIENKPITEIIEVTPALASTLKILRNDLDSGRLAVGYIYTKFNEQCDPAQKLKSEKAMGGLLRKHGLTISPGQHDANGRRGVCCLSWDKKTEEFVQTLQTSPKPSPHQETSANTVETDIADIPDVVDGEKYDIEGDIL